MTALVHVFVDGENQRRKHCIWRAVRSGNSRAHLQELVHEVLSRRGRGAVGKSSHKRTWLPRSKIRNLLPLHFAVSLGHVYNWAAKHDAGSLLILLQLQHTSGRPAGQQTQRPSIASRPRSGDGVSQELRPAEVLLLLHVHIDVRTWKSLQHTTLHHKVGSQDAQQLHVAPLNELKRQSIIRHGWRCATRLGRLAQNLQDQRGDRLTGVKASECSFWLAATNKRYKVSDTVQDVLEQAALRCDLALKELKALQVAVRRSLEYLSSTQGELRETIQEWGR